MYIAHYRGSRELTGDPAGLREGCDGVLWPHPGWDEAGAATHGSQEDWGGDDRGPTGDGTPGLSL